MQTSIGKISNKLRFDHESQRDRQHNTGEVNAKWQTWKKLTRKQFWICVCTHQMASNSLQLYLCITIKWLMSISQRDWKKKKKKPVCECYLIIWLKREREEREKIEMKFIKNNNQPIECSIQLKFFSFRYIWMRSPCKKTLNDQLRAASFFYIHSKFMVIAKK